MQVENLRTKQKEENSSLFREMCAPVFTFASNNHQISSLYTLLFANLIKILLENNPKKIKTNWITKQVSHFFNKSLR